MRRGPLAVCAVRPDNPRPFHCPLWERGRAPQPRGESAIAFRGPIDNRNRVPQVRVNHRIRVPEVRVIDDSGAQLGIMSSSEALRLAQDRGLDLVEVNPKAEPPVCKVMDYGKFKYEEKKKANEQRKRQTTVEIKEVKVRPKTDEHDLDTKIKHIKRFLEEGNKAKITVRFRGREVTHPEKGREVVDDIIKALEGLIVVEQMPVMEGKAMTALIAPKPGAFKKATPAPGTAPVAGEG
ncbi:MAG: translation initiation factor IF-3 [Myxococcales bacterium]|nr:translation initiation factor IF-3 [Myxococcales bacterium]